MKRPFTRLEKKQLLIFALIAFGIIRLPEPLSSFF